MDETSGPRLSPTALDIVRAGQFDMEQRAHHTLSELERASENSDAWRNVEWISTRVCPWVFFVLAAGMQYPVVAILAGVVLLEMIIVISVDKVVSRRLSFRQDRLRKQCDALKTLLKGINVSLELIHRSKQPFCLYLRAFRTEASRVPDVNSGLWLSESGELLDHIKDRPTVAVASSIDLAPLPFLHYLPATDDGWHTLVSELARAAEEIVISVDSPTGGIYTELALLVDLSLEARTTVLIPRQLFFDVRLSEQAESQLREQLGKFPRIVEVLPPAFRFLQRGLDYLRDGPEAKVLKEYFDSHGLR
jgi:hypothetical protein